MMRFQSLLFLKFLLLVLLLAGEEQVTGSFYHVHLGLQRGTRSDNGRYSSLQLVSDEKSQSKPAFSATRTFSQNMNDLKVFGIGSRSLTSSSSATMLFASTDNAQEAGNQPVDVEALVKYSSSIAIQLSLFYALFSALDYAVTAANIEHVPFAANWILFYGCALKSRIFNPLQNTRPQVSTLETEDVRKRVMPSWTPPGFIFPIMWLLIIAPLRATASALILETTLSYTSPAIIFALLLHLSIGDVWNTINNVEQRYGVAVVGVLCVWLSKAFAAYQYYQVNPLAGELLAVTLIWLTIAATLVTATWRLNPDPATGNPEPLYPVVGDKKTEFMWFTN